MKRPHYFSLCWAILRAQERAARVAVAMAVLSVIGAGWATWDTFSQ